MVEVGEILRAENVNERSDKSFISAKCKLVASSYALLNFYKMVALHLLNAESTLLRHRESTSGRHGPLSSTTPLPEPTPVSLVIRLEGAARSPPRVELRQRV